MLDEQIKQLVNQGIDGDLSKKERAKLESYLLESPEARSYLKMLQELDRTLRQVKAEAPPRHLKKAIMKSIGHRQRAGERASPTRRSWPRPRINWSYAFSFSAGVAAGALVFALLGTRLSEGKMARSNLTGTLLPAPNAQPFETIIDLPEIAGKVGWTASPDVAVVELALDSQVPLQVTLEFDTEVLLSAFRHLGPGAVQVDISRRSLSFIHSGEQIHSFAFKRHTPSAPRVNMKILANGRLLYERLLNTGGKPGRP
ncbi:MAG: anti-sigma factor family protein [bacterium]